MGVTRIRFSHEGSVEHVRSSGIGRWRVLRGEGALTSDQILWAIRLPRTVLIALTGAALSGSGAAYQGLFRNALVAPDILGAPIGLHDDGVP